MHIVKLLLRAENGAPVAALTLKEASGGSVLTLPRSAKPVIATDEAGRQIPFELSADGYLFASSPTAILVENDGEKWYAFRKSGGSFPYKKWVLLSALPEGSPTEEAPKTSSEISDITEETEPPKTVSEEEETEESPVEEAIADVPPSKDVDPALSLTAKLEREEKRRKIQEIFDRGEPFPGFEKLIDGSKWVRMPEEDYLIGILEEAGETIVLYGVPGRLGEAPDDNCDWTFLPASEENEDWGYYICKSADFD